MHISLIQMNMTEGAPDENYTRAAQLIRKAAAAGTDVIVLPETWNVGFFPHENLARLSDDDGARTKAEIGALAGELGVNIVAGSVTNRRKEAVYNTAYIFDRSGKEIAVYDKCHLFSPMDEQEFFTSGDHVCRFELDGVSCGIIICYDLRFPEWTRKLAVEGLDLLFVVSQWPGMRAEHLRTLIRARAIENQMYLACCNSCGRFADTQYGGCSAVIDPWGDVLAEGAGAGDAEDVEQIITCELDMTVLEGIRSSINVFRDRRPELYGER